MGAIHGSKGYWDHAAASPNFLLLPMMLAGLTLTMWLLVKGVDVRKWEAKVATVR